MIAVDNLSKSFGAQLLFDGISFKVNRKERVGLVGRNGHGRHPVPDHCRAESADSGTVSIPRNYRIGYLEQEPVFTARPSSRRRPGPAPAEQDKMWKAENPFRLASAPKVSSVPPSSSGLPGPLNLARSFRSDLLLLDEPNNYLDITSIRWLGRFLKSWPGEFVLITHDRSFMDSVITHVIGIHRKKTRKISGDTGKYYAQLAQDEETYEKTRQNDERKRKEIELFISKFRAKAQLVGLVQSRIKTLAKMEKREKLDKIAALDFSFSYKPFHGKYMLSASDLSFSYDPARPLIRDFTISIGAGDRVCVVGRNGRGKTTLLKLFAGVLRPQG
jgi:ATP-binding cassette subfamily F protein 3